MTATNAGGHELSSIVRDYDRQPVPAAVRKSWWTMALVNGAVGVNVAALLFGGHGGPPDLRRIDEAVNLSHRCARAS